MIGFDEVAHAGPEQLDAAHAADYDAKSGFDPASSIELLRAYGLGADTSVVYSFDPAQAGERLEEWLAGATSDPAEGWARAELGEHVRAEHSTYSWLVEPLLEHTGFEVRSAQHERGVYTTYVGVER